MVIKTTHSNGGEVEEILDIRSQEDLDARDTDVVGERNGCGTGTRWSWAEAVGQLADKNVYLATGCVIVEYCCPCCGGLGAENVYVNVLFNVVEDKLEGMGSTHEVCGHS